MITFRQQSELERGLRRLQTEYYSFLKRYKNRRPWENEVDLTIQLLTLELKQMEIERTLYELGINY